MAKSKLTQLGSKVAIPDSPETSIIERIKNHSPLNYYCARFTCVEFSCLCEVTSQPDFAHILIDYIPGSWLVESKSLKLYLHSFRNYNSFHERTISTIASTLFNAVSPHWMRVIGYWFPRGGIPIDVFFTLGKIPNADIYIPDVHTYYRGR